MLFLRKTFISVCSSMIAECENGFYNSDCTAKCGHCLEEAEACHKETGHCASGCKQHFHPPLCQGNFVTLIWKKK